MDNKIKILIAVGASITANCQPCLKTAITQAKAVGAERKEILEAISIGRIVRKGATGKMDKVAATLTGEDMNKPEECPFGSTEQEVREWINQGEPEDQPERGCI